MATLGAREFLLWCVVANLGVWGLVGCANIQQPPKVETESHIIREPETASLGSLWEPNNGRAFMFEDRRASRVGDIVIVQIVEQHSGSKTASTKADRSASLNAGASGGFFDLHDLLGDVRNLFSADVETGNSFEGDGSTSRQDSLTGTIAAQVVEVLPNGDLRIQGKRKVKVNSETQTMTIKGIVRRIDLDTQNTVASSAVANADISYTGLGVVDDVQTPGWLTRVFNWVTPF
ncbi:MAG: flagellar basal body L-ring protein FlgH [Nitrospirota bacterium]|nr:flagellar basal body L-ring protein FlgH [Nitrospirota bacterium]MDH5586564.1 flagellar basal body L-ring protein FlgH [Nitrospirota bacterium]